MARCLEKGTETHGLELSPATTDLPWLAIQDLNVGKELGARVLHCVLAEIVTAHFYQRWSTQDFIPTTLSSTGVLFSPTPAFQDSKKLVLEKLFAEGSLGVWESQLFVQRRAATKLQ